MNDNKTKIKLVFVPYLIISLAIIIGWSLLDWLLFTKLNVYPVNENIRTIVIPLVLSITSLFIWLRKRLDLLNLNSLSKTNGGGIFLCFFILVPTMVATFFFALQCIILATGKVTQLSSISQIEQKEPSKFYTLKNFYLDKKHVSIKKQFSHEGKGNHLDMSLYLAVPILNSVKDTLGLNCIGWYGVQYSHTARGFFDHHFLKQPWDAIFNDIGKIENSKEVKSFINESMMKFNNLNLNQFSYLSRISETGGEYDNFVSVHTSEQQYVNLFGAYDNYVLAIKNNTKYDTKSRIVLLPFNESLVKKAVDNLIIALTIFVIGSLLFLIIVLSNDLKSEKTEYDVSHVMTMDN